MFDRRRTTVGSLTGSNVALRRTPTSSLRLHVTASRAGAEHADRAGQLEVERGLRGLLPLLGPAFVAAVAYVDPGNFVTNIEGGARFGYRLVWVIVVANAAAMLVQYLAAKMGVVTGSNLAELCREHLPVPVSRGLWVQAELVAMATDLAEFVGAALALQLLFKVPALPSGLLTAAVSFALLGLQRRGYRRFELVIAGMLGVVLLGFGYQLVLVGVDPGALTSALVPGFAGTDSVVLACGIVGATVMPHAVYLHSALATSRPAVDDPARRRLLKAQRVDILAALGLAGLVNLSMLAVAARTFTGTSVRVDDMTSVHAGLGRLVGPGMALAFALALLAAGLSSSSVATYAGQVVMAGYIQRRIPLLLRRAITMAPALGVLAAGVDPTRALVLSQVVLSFGIPFVLAPLVALTARRDVMGAHVNRCATTVAAGATMLAICCLNAFMLSTLLRS